ncbi:hypothetical protein [Sandarakinorhabdus oryzae]|uniref:hypothetical protein n=1 Tax=Sandarakinorhabdus oryzae TaxID=2675220 RepID=UPI0012E2C45A|nr:hypothetical protein [Sandarakinorhabdus oryzae]
MNRSIIILAALAVATPALAADKPPAPPAGPAVQDCLITRNIQQTDVGRDGKWYARLRNKSWWRNSMDCPALSPRRAMVHTSPIGSQCRGDIVEIVDFTMGGVSFGGCGLGRWERVDGPPGKEPRKPKN